MHNHSNEALTLKSLLNVNTVDPHTVFICNLFLPAKLLAIKFLRSTLFSNKSVKYKCPLQMSRNPNQIRHFSHPCCINRSSSFLHARVGQSFQKLIYKFNINLFFKKRGRQLLERGT